MFTRRGAIIGGGAVAASLVVAPAAHAGEFTYKGWRFNTDAVPTPLADDLIDSFQAQIDMVEGLPIRPEAKAFFRTVDCFVEETTRGGPGVYGAPRRRMTLSVTPQPKDNPVFLHELLHAWHHQKIPGGFQNRTILGFFEAAKARPAFPANAYMFKDVGEFFAMCASVVLWGKAARPPGTRANVKQRLPLMYDWIVSEFGFTES